MTILDEQEERTDSTVGSLGSIPIVGGEVPQLIDDVFMGNIR